MKERRNGSRSVGEIGLGAGPLSDEGRPDEDRAIATIHAASKAGVSLIGAADSYAISDEDFGHSGGHTRQGTAWEINGDPEHLKRACRDSLPRLGASRNKLVSSLSGPGAMSCLRRSTRTGALRSWPIRPARSARRLESRR